MYYIYNNIHRTKKKAEEPSNSACENFLDNNENFLAPELFTEGMDLEPHNRAQHAIEPDIQKKNLPFPVLDTNGTTQKIAGESSLLVTDQCSLILMVEKTTLATASLQRPQLLIHIVKAYQN